ncbi:MAG: nucleotidyltransferase family protein [Gemmatales bacterium]|nr:nucleotidyltransferase family protein [Gemmatales bacterium]
MLEAIILAAGLGTRLRPYTEQTPKPLLPVQGKPLLHWILGALPQEVTKVYIVVHYLAEQIETWLRHQRLATEYQLVYQHRPRGSGDALLACRPFIQSERLLVVNGDDLYAPRDLERLADHSFALLGYPVEEPRAFGILRLREDGTLAELVEKPDWPGPQLANTGAYLLPRAIGDIQPGLSPRGEYELTEMVNKLAQVRPCQVVHARFWFPIGTIQAWQAAQTLDLRTWFAAKTP